MCVYSVCVCLCVLVLSICMVSRITYRIPSYIVCTISRRCGIYGIYALYINSCRFKEAGHVHGYSYHRSR